ncbi:MAG TPA: BTAD domain-containing putative transcriptional regulator [Acidimicrobiia bacterium]|nr:BTAD domain-containing putative transcriptional regulator [Acidimicrobiia bacterium]
MSERPPTRAHLSSLLFAEADDPLRALRWNLVEIRRSLGDDGSLEGDPVVLRLPSDSAVDVEILTKGSWTEAVSLPGLGEALLDGWAVPGAPAFESWLLSQQRYVAAASEAILHEAALGSMSQGNSDLALGYAVRATVMNPLDENHQALLIRLYRLTGDDIAAEQQFVACTELFERELRVVPGAAIAAALRETGKHDEAVADEPSIEAIIEAGTAAVAAGAGEAGVESLRAAVRMADNNQATNLRVNSRLELAQALIHSLGGLDEEGLAELFEADEIALGDNDLPAAAQARAELGYVDFLRGRYDRAELWLTDALELAYGSPSTTAKATTYLGSVESDRGNYTRATDLLAEANQLSRSAGDLRGEAYGVSMLGRISLLSNDLDNAADHLDASIRLAETDHWLAFIPWPQALRGEVQLARGDPAGAAELLRQAFARACQLGDPCWEGMAARGLALVAEATSETEHAFAVLADARVRCNRLADPYLWLDGYILDAQCDLGRRHDHPDTQAWIHALRELSSRTGMKELNYRSLLHGAAIGNEGDRAAAALFTPEIENPSLHPLLGTQGPIAGAH